MAANKVVRIAPVNIGATTATVVNAGTVTGNTIPAGSTAVANLYYIVRHIRIVNSTATNKRVALWIDTVTNGNNLGKEFAFAGQVGTPGTPAGTLNGTSGVTVSANSFVEWFGLVRLDPADFLTAVAETTNFLTIEMEGEVGVQ